MAGTSASFSGSIPEYYDRCLGPAWFDAFAADLARRLPPDPPGDVLELACGTGGVTRHLRTRLALTHRLVATDISKAMLDYARGKLADLDGIEWLEADATSLPAGDGEFGAVVCGFGIMFFPDRLAALREARRALQKGGILLFNVWDRIEENPHVAATGQVFEALFPGEEEMRFTIPYSMHDPALLRELLAKARFEDVRIERKRLPIEAISARAVATGQIRGTPRSHLIEERGIAPDDVIEKVAAALAKLGGAEPYRGSAQALVIEARAA
jgi:ubiquinone/menaquinone biosynthesis C-methylase UbiE